jgi:hypothetical protein
VEWVQRAARHFTQHNAHGRHPITGVIFYRFTADAWAINNWPEVLAVIKAA